MNNTGGVDAHFATSPFHEQEIKLPGVRTLTTNYEILGGPATALVIATSTKFRDANPKTYQAFYDALNEAIRGINADKRAAAKVYLEQAKDTKNSVDDIYAMINASDYAYTLTPQKVGKTADFMALLLAGLPVDLPGTTVNRLCGSSMLRDGNAGVWSHSCLLLFSHHSSSTDSAKGVRTERSSTSRGANPNPVTSKNRSKEWFVQSA